MQKFAEVALYFLAQEEHWLIDFDFGDLLLSVLIKVGLNPFSA